MKEVKPKFTVKIFTGEAILAESDSTDLCLSVLAAISKGSQSLAGYNSFQHTDIAKQGDESINKGSKPDNLAKMAEKISVTKDELIGACDPQADSPYITLFPKYWEKLKKMTGTRGRSAVAASVLAATLLAFWFDIMGIGNPNMKAVHKTIDTLGIQDKNASRAIKACAWLQQRTDGTLIINPARYSLAISIVKKYITQKEDGK